jgi:TonB family protein
MRISPDLRHGLPKTTRTLAAALVLAAAGGTLLARPGAAEAVTPRSATLVAADTAPTGAESRVVADDSVVEAPQLLGREMVSRLVARYYPPLLRQTGTEGSVTLHMTVDAEGHVQRGSFQVVSFTDPGFVEAARRVALALRFRPARSNGKPVASEVSFPINFRLSRG